MAQIFLFKSKCDTVSLATNVETLQATHGLNMQQKQKNFKTHPWLWIIYEDDRRKDNSEAMSL